MPYADPVPALKQQIADELVRVAERWPRMLIASFFGVDRARISDLRHGRMNRFSLERLVRMAAEAGVEVELRLTRKRIPATLADKGD